MIRRLLCWLGLHGPEEVEEAVVILSFYERRRCLSCKSTRYYIMGVDGHDELNFIPLPWTGDDAK